MKCLLVCILFFASSVSVATDFDEQPSVSRRVLICDQWQWIGGQAVTWGCLSTPRQAYVAGGKVTDEVIADLQNQINDLKGQIKELKK